jgi:hypothetical protein
LQRDQSWETRRDRNLLTPASLVRGIGLGLFLRRHFADPFQEPALADDWNTVGFRWIRLCERPTVVLKRPAKLAVMLSQGVRPCRVTSAKASARFMDASRPVKAMIPPSSDDASGSCFGFSVPPPS